MSDPPSHLSGAYNSPETSYECVVTGDLDATASTCVIVVPGLTDGPRTLAYADGGALTRACERRGYALVRFELSSSYERYGARTLDDDAREMDACARWVRRMCPRVREIIVFGHSTGCQSACHFLASGRYESARSVTRLVLQAGVSDRDWYDAAHGREVMRAWVARARRMSPEDIMPEETPGTNGVRVKARRFVSLAGVGGDDDWFSLDIFDGSRGAPSKIDERLSGGKCARVDVRVVASTADEYVPYAADVARAHNERVRDAFARVAKSARVHYIDANHDLSDMKTEDVEGFVDFIFS